MVFAKRTLTRLAPVLFGAAIAFFGLSGCGGETGGAPSGIAGALTNATIKVSSFSLTTSSAINDLVEVNRQTFGDGTAPVPNDVESVAGALYPTRNSNSFRVTLKGAGSDREDVSLYYNVFNRTNSIYDVADPESEVSGDGYRTSLAKLFVATRPDVDQPGYDGTEPNLDPRPSLWPVQPRRDKNGAPVRDGSNNVVFEYSDSGQDVPLDRTVFRLRDAFLYAQLGNRKAVRTGRRNVVVQFFSSTAKAAQDHYDEVRTIGDPVEAAKNETLFLQANLTNSYVFTVDIRPNRDVTLTSAFQTNNGDNGLVDTNTFDVRAKDLPAKWKSVKFEAYEESTGLSNEGIVYTEIVNRPGGDPTFAATAIRFANRQRVLKVYATCYEGSDAQGAILAQTLDYDRQEEPSGGADPRLANYNKPQYPVQFIPTPIAKPGPIFPANALITTSSENLLKEMTLAETPTTLVPTIRGTVSRDGPPLTISLSASFLPEPRYPNGAETPAPILTPTTVTLANTSVDFTRVVTQPAAGSFPDFVFTVGAAPSATSLLEAIDPPSTAGTVQWQTASTTRYFFSKKEVPAGKKAAALVHIVLPGFGGAALAEIDLPIPLGPDLGSTGGTVN